jgi:excinuclease ABC subunit A
MTRKTRVPMIRLRGVRHNNLKNFDLDLPTRELIVVTGVSGSGKSSLAFDTLFAEGQRRYIETFSPYARQFFDRMDKPQVDRIEGIPPAIAIEQRNAVKTTRSTVGTMTELTDYMKVLWPHIAGLYCRQCGLPVRKDSPGSIWTDVNERARNGNARNGNEVLVTFDLPLSERLTLSETLALVAKQGYQRLLVGGSVVRLEEVLVSQNATPKGITVVQDCVKMAHSYRARFAEACEQAYHFGKGRLTIHWLAESKITAAALYSSAYHCAACDIAYREPSSALFSFNHPVGACAACRGFGRIITIDYQRAIPDRSLTLTRGAVKPWQTGQGADSQRDLARMCRQAGIPMDVPFDQLRREHQDRVINGDPDYGKDEEHEWPRAWYGVKGYFRWLESKAYKMHVRVLLSRYRAYSTCPECKGARFQPEALLYKARTAEGLITLADFYQLPIERAHEVATQLALPGEAEHADLALAEVRSRLQYLIDVGLGYLTLDRPTRSLSGGETERVNLTTCLGTRLVNTLYVLDEPSVGLHARDTERLVRILKALRDAGNTVVVVEHEASVMRAADRIVDLGPGHGEAGGEVICNGTFSELTRCRASITGQYLSGARRTDTPERRAINETTPRLTIAGASDHNLKNVTVEIPLGRFVCLTGVSGSGKTTLARDVLVPQLQARFSEQCSTEEENENGETEQPRAANGASLIGYENLRQVVLVDQSALGRTPRSNPAVYIGAFDSIRELFADSDLARQRGLSPSAFSFNSSQGQCERCRGAGFEKIEMQFLSDVYIRCPDCNGRRYRSHILEVKLKASLPGEKVAEWSIADLLEASVDTAILLLLSFIHKPAARRAVGRLKLLQDVGLGYLRLGQPVNTLSGGESQRLKLIRHLADIADIGFAECGPALFVLDEPTTGLHFEDVRVLLTVLQRLVESGNSLLVIEHNLDVIKSADWVIDLGPDAGERGGELVAEGTPEQIAETSESHTGAALREVLRMYGVPALAGLGSAPNPSEVQFS